MTRLHITGPVREGLGLTTLPIRTEPLGESWLGYTNRVAAVFGVTWSELMGPVLPGQNLIKANWQAGVCTRPESARALARYFRLTTQEVQSMHLDAAYGGSAVHVPDRARLEFDPFGEVPCGDQVRLRVCGPIPNRQRQPVCWLCRRREPEWLPLEWRLAWFPACEEHNLLMSNEPAGQMPVGPEVIAAQALIRSHLKPSDNNAFFFEHLTTIVKDMLCAPIGAYVTSFSSVEP